MRSRASLSAASASRLAGLRRRIDLGRGHPQADLGEIDAVELGGQFDQRAVAARLHVGDDAAHGRFHVLRRLALHAEECAETRRKIGALAIQSKRHGLNLPGC